MILFSYLHFNWLCVSWKLQRIFKKYPFWKYKSWFPSEVSKLPSANWFIFRHEKKNILTNIAQWSNFCFCIPLCCSGARTHASATCSLFKLHWKIFKKWTKFGKGRIRTWNLRSRVQSADHYTSRAAVRK